MWQPFVSSSDRSATLAPVRPSWSQTPAARESIIRAMMDPHANISVSCGENLEIEWQFDAPDLRSVRTTLAGLGTVNGPGGAARLTLAQSQSHRLVDTYLDTDDWRVFRSGYALRVRRAHGRTVATMKSLAPRRGALAVRREVTQPLPSSDYRVLGTLPGPVERR